MSVRDRWTHHGPLPNMASWVHHDSRVTFPGSCWNVAMTRRVRLEAATDFTDADGNGVPVEPGSYCMDDSGVHALLWLQGEHGDSAARTKHVVTHASIREALARQQLKYQDWTGQVGEELASTEARLPE